MINAFPQQKTESSLEAWMQAADRQLPSASRTVRQNPGRPNIEAINKLNCPYWKWSPMQLGSVASVFGS